ncbi:glycosyltransferase family 2 protein [Winogradskyella sp.]|uniref:glycosyltransferase family 2 protein n=1 Tax=Winogradskyella sp. TaxID=1883156 RepID=UPI003AB3640F
MKKNITLVIFNEQNDITWELGKKFSIEYTTKSLLACRDEILSVKADYIMFWDAKFPVPSTDELFCLDTSKGNLFHIGPALGIHNNPTLLDSIQPTSMLHIVANLEQDYSSWKNTFRGCLLEISVFKSIPLLDYSDSLDIIGLDFGYKAMKSGVITRFSTELSKNIVKEKDFILEKRNSLFFIRNNFDTKAFVWTYCMNFLSISPLRFFKALKTKKSNFRDVYRQPINKKSIEGKDTSVSIVIATLDRYSYLKSELEELRRLSLPANEIIIIDQTPKANRSQEFLNSFKELPIVYIETDKIGQCSSRNLGIKNATSKFIWFLDDDMEEIPAGYLSDHLETIYSLNADVSCGIPDEIGTTYINRSIPKITLSNGFPTNDVVVKKSLLDAVDGFDEKMDRLQSEDQEIGLRLIKKGALSVKNNQLRIVHLRAGSGGLRNHNVRKITFSSSRESLWQQRILNQSEIYLCYKHFSKKQVFSKLLLNVRGTFIVRGNYIKQLLKVLISFIKLPQTVLIIELRRRKAKKMF